jgi:GntR family transcriptional regulator, rspAB operon transcriptional repressor
LSYHVLYFERYELMINLECLEKTRGESAREYVTRILRSNILNLNLIPGQSISENEVAELLKMSRTPVREAFIRLFQDNLIEIYPQKGT